MRYKEEDTGKGDKNREIKKTMRTEERKDKNISLAS
jgi:hypothetical protein